VDPKAKQHQRNTDEIIKTQAAELKRLSALIGVVPVDEGPRIARLEQALREQVATAKAHEEDSLARLATINRIRRLADTWAGNGLGRFASELRRAIKNGSENEATD
jgi:hypothetical protein